MIHVHVIFIILWTFFITEIEIRILECLDIIMAVNTQFCMDIEYCTAIVCTLYISRVYMMIRSLSVLLAELY